jgi:voltage-gated potassium channel
VLLAIVLAILIIVFTPDGTVPRFLALFVLGAALLLALRTAEAPPRVQRYAAGIVGLASIGAIGSLVTDRGTPEFAATLTLVLVGLTPLVLASRLVRNPEVTGQSLIGAACVYLLMGLFFALIFSLTAYVTGSPFFASLSHPSLGDYIYFSYITITTVGYGDLAPATTLGRMLAVTEAMTGQLYLVTVVALLVSNYRGRRSKDD